MSAPDAAEKAFIHVTTERSEIGLFDLDDEMIARGINVDWTELQELLLLHDWVEDGQLPFGNGNQDRWVRRHQQ